MGFPGNAVVKNLLTMQEIMGLIPGLGRALGGGNGNLLQYSCLGNPRDRGAWRATVHGVAEVSCDLATKQEQYIADGVNV